MIFFRYLGGDILLSLWKQKKRRKMAAQKRILLEDWQEIKPYNKTAKSDLYFLGISNEINDKIYEKKFHIPLQNFIREEGISLFCMFLNSYLEDIISGS